MRKWLMSLGLMALLAQSALAFRPSGWVYSNYPWAYDSGSGDWYWFNTADTQYIANMGSGQWSRLSQSAMASGWVFYQTPFAYAQGNSAWHYINEADTQWVVNMRTGTWSRFGSSTAPAGMVLIPAGTLPDIGNGALNVTSFYIGKYEVTWGEWQTVHAWAATNGYAMNAGAGTATNYPVHSVNWYDVVKWSNAKSELEGRTPVYTVGGAVYRSGNDDDVVVNAAATGYRLPTDAEWEYAARGGTQSQDYTYSGGNDINAVAWYNGNSGGGTHAVGTKAANELGLHDMSGNVWEWCFDWYPGYVGPGRVGRGGSWNYFEDGCRVSNRYYPSPGLAGSNRGFRLARLAGN